MKGRKRFGILASAGCILLALVASPAVFGDGKIGARCNGSFLAGSAGAKGLAQGKSRRRRGSRGKRAASANNNSSANQARPQSSMPQTNATPARQQGPLSQVTYELPIRKPLAGEEQARGLLTQVDCGAKGMTFVVQANDRTLKLHTPDFNSIKLTSFTSDVSGDLTCGARKPTSNVVVTYRPTKEARAKLDGELVAVEFVPKDFELKR